MERVLAQIRIRPGAEAEFDRRHAAIDPDLKRTMRESGLRNVSVFRRGTDS